MSTTAIAAEVKQQLEPVALKVDVVQNSIVQLIAKVDELAANQVHNIPAVWKDMRSSQVPERGTKPDEPDVAASVRAAPNAGDIAEADQPASNNCDIDACKKAYFTFNPADCTYQPLEGPRRLCTK